MKGERYALRVGGFLVTRASRRLPTRIRAQRHQEWLAELPAILHDRAAGSAPRRLARMLAFAADTLRGATFGSNSCQYQGAHRSGTVKYTGAVATFLLLPLIVLGVVLALLLGVSVVLAWEAWIVYQAFHGANLYGSLSLLLVSVAFLVLNVVRPRGAGARCWFLGNSVTGAAQFLCTLAQQYHWGHPLLFLIIDYCGAAAFVSLTAAAIVLLVRSPPERPTSGSARAVN